MEGFCHRDSEETPQSTELQLLLKMFLYFLSKRDYHTTEFLCKGN